MRLLAALALLLITSCATSSEELDGLIIRNETDFIAQNVTLKIPATQYVISCSSILPNSECSMGFPAERNKNHPAFLRWEQNGRHYEKPLVGGSSKPRQTEGQLHAVVKIKPRGGLEIYLER